MSLPAGAQRIPLLGFVVMTIVGCSLLAAAFTAVGMLAGTAWATVNATLGRVLLVIAVIVLAALLVKRS